MENKQWLFYLLVFSMAAGVAWLFWRTRKSKDMFKAAMTKNKETDMFHLTSRRLKELNRELVQMLKEKTGSDVSDGYYKFLGTNESGVTDSVRKAMHGKIKISLFNMDGATMDEPIMKMNSSSPQLFAILGSAGFLTMIGKIVSTATWCSATTTPSMSNLNSYWSCIEKIDWKNIQTWHNLSSVVSGCAR